MSFLPPSVVYCHWTPWVTRQSTNTGPSLYLLLLCWALTREIQLNHPNKSEFIAAKLLRLNLPQLLQLGRLMKQQDLAEHVLPAIFGMFAPHPTSFSHPNNQNKPPLREKKRPRHLLLMLLLQPQFTKVIPICLWDPLGYF